MSDIDTTDRAVERHESKGNPHADSASASDLSNHENAGNPHSDSASLSDTASLASENGEITSSASGSSVNLSVSLSNTYKPGVFVPAVGITSQYTNSPIIRVKSTTTNANGNVTGLTLEMSAGYSDGKTISWWVMGEPA